MEGWFIENQGYFYTFILSLIPTSIAGCFSWYKYKRLEERTAKDFKYNKEVEYRNIVSDLHKKVKEQYCLYSFDEPSSQEVYTRIITDNEISSYINHLENTLEIYMETSDKRVSKIESIKEIISKKDFLEFKALEELIREL